ncbi:MAG TPA: hypothetical protein VMU39_14185 [Solirubrobacteraceae bacterium]|nr:hypothetical protein [Solirubrobacteraceae bacterium]
MIRNRTRTRLALAALATLAASFGPAALAQAKQTCTPSHSTTLASDSYARVYGRHGNAYVCIRASGKTSLLQGASPAGDHFALGGTYVGWSSSPAPDPSNPSALPHSIVTVMHIPDHRVNDRWYPAELNETVDKIVVLSDGAAAWAMTPPPGSDGAFTEIQGTDRAGHPADQFSDDHADVVGSSLHILAGKTIAWRYADGTTGTQTLF